MKKLTKMAVERVNNILRQKIKTRLETWDKANPIPERVMTIDMAIKIAVEDPQWRKAIVRRGIERQRCHYGSVTLDLDDIKKDCAFVRLEYERIEKANRQHKVRRAQVAAQLEKQYELLMNSIIILGKTPEEALEAANRF